MKLIKPFTQILTEVDINLLERIERAGRTCYKSEDKITKGSAKAFVEKIIKSGHESVIEHEHLSVLFVCDRGVSHELVRHRLASFSQESTRYCNYSNDKFGSELTFIIPCWTRISEFDSGFGNDFLTNNENEWLSVMSNAEESYNTMIEEGWQPQQARSILPNSLKTEIVVTANLREWRLIFKQRTSEKAHPQMRELMIPLLKKVQSLIPVIFDDIVV